MERELSPVKTGELTGADLAYWVARGNLRGSSAERDVRRAHYGAEPHHDPVDEPSMRAFVEGKFGSTLASRCLWP